jgi:hypothetical protein
MLSVGMIIGGAFRLIRERPGSVLIWGVIYSLGAFAAGYFMMTSMAPLDATSQRPDPSQALAAVGSAFGKMLLLQLFFFCLYTILLTAAQRAVLRPQESGFASIRFGGDELRMLGLGIFLGFLFMIGYFIAAAILGILAVALGFAGGAPGAMLPMMIVGIVVILCLLLFFWVRVSLAFPLTLMRGRFVLAEAWRLSRGHFWTMLGGYLVLMLIILAIAIIGSLVLQSGYWSQLMGGGLTGANARQAAQAQMAAQYALGVPMLMTLAFGVVMGSLTIAFTGASVAIAARALASDQHGMAETFA